MKKAAKKIAVVLILVMLTGSFTGCITAWAAKNDIGELGLLVIFPIPILPALDLITSPIQLVIFIVEAIKYSELKNRVKMMDNIDTFSANISFIPETELFSLKEKINSLQDAEIAAFTNKVSSFSDIEFSAMVEAFNNLSETDIVSSMEILNSMSDETLIAELINFQHIAFQYKK